MSEAGRALRLFVAIELPPAWIEALQVTQEAMKAAIAREEGLEGVRVRWVRPEGIHLTLKFIGEVPRERLEPIDGQLAQAVPASPGMRLSLARIGTFSDRRAPRVIWAGVDTEPPQAMLPLFESIETWLAAAGVPRERRGFRPHLTLARLPEGLSSEQRVRLAEVTSSVDTPNVGPFAVEHVSLMQSFLGPGGARYECLGRWP